MSQNSIDRLTEEQLNKYKELVTALDTLSISIRYFTNKINIVDVNNSSDHELLDMIRDCIIRRFKYCFELTWKYLVIYMEQKEKIEIAIISPKTVFRTACQAKLISENEADQALQMTDDRNKTSHIYREEVADYIAKSSVKYHQLMVKFASRFV